ncbi:alanine racemase [Rubricella aquisinus]|nr:alanine racemase [Rubricella aquisinus]
MGTGILTIDLDAIAANWRALDAMSSARVETAAVVKADAYGLGIAPVARALQKAGARSFFVATAEETPALRQAVGNGADLYVFSGFMPTDAEIYRATGAIPCLNSAAQVSHFSQQTGMGRCAIQIDSGMNRLGMEPEEYAALSERIAGLNPVLTLSHLACADEPEHPQNTAQLEVFSATAEGRRSLAATGGTLLGAPYHFDMTRPGIGLYGGLPFADARPVVRLSLPVIQTREVMPGEAVGYGAAWTAKTPCRIATVSAGYADGLIRAMGNRARLWAGDTPCPLAGRVSMDLLTVDVSHLEHDPDTLDILGPHQSVDDLADAAGTIGYEILTSLGARYHRRYIGG